MSSDRLPDIVLPEPSRTARVMMTLRAVGILFLGVGALITSLVIQDLYHEARSNNEESRCRAEIVDDLTSLESRINATGWTAMLAAFRDDQAAVDLHAGAMAELLVELPEKRDRVERRFEICSK